jgi:hypothetical protein
MTARAFVLVILCCWLPPLSPRSSLRAADAERRARIYPAMIGVAPVVADPAKGPEWQSIRRHTHGIWVNGAGANADQVAGMLKMLDKDEFPAILPGGCSKQDDGTLSCGSGASLKRLRTANKRLAGTGKRLVAEDRAFNLADVIGKEPIRKIIAAIDAAENDPEYKGIRSGILLHPRDGLNHYEDVKRAIDAIDAGGVVAIEVSPSLLGHNNIIKGCANIWRYTQSKGKQAVWLMNGPRYAVDDWFINTKHALDSWKKEYDLVPDVVAPIATMVGGKMEILPEGDGSWPPRKPYTYMGAIHVLFGLCGWLDAPSVAVRKINPIPGVKTTEPTPAGNGIASNEPNRTVAKNVSAFDASCLPQWTERLRAYVKETVSAGARPRCRLNLMSDTPSTVKLLAADDHGLTVELNGGKMPVPWSQLKTPDYVELAQGITSEQDARSQVLIGVFLCIAGRIDDGTTWLAKAALADPQTEVWVKEARAALKAAQP